MINSDHYSTIVQIATEQMTKQTGSVLERSGEA